MNDFLKRYNVSGLSTTNNEFEEQMGVFFKLFTILYADDTVLLAESAEDLQSQLNAFENYCQSVEVKSQYI